MNTLPDFWAEVMLRATLHGAIVVGAVFVIGFLFSNYMTSKAQCWLWRLVFIKLLLLTIVTTPIKLPILPAPANDSNVAELAENDTALTSDRSSSYNYSLDSDDRLALVSPTREIPPNEFNQPESTESATGSMQLFAIESSTLLFSIWLVGVLAFFGWLTRTWWLARELRNSCVPINDPKIHQHCRELCNHFGIKSKPELSVSSMAHSPLLVGNFVPTIIFPVETLQRLDDDQLRLVIAHELSHLKRRDLWWSWLPTVVQILFFFHPFVWAARTRWLLSREMACDELVLSVTGKSAANYADALINVSSCMGLAGSSRIANRAFDSTCMVQTSFSLKRRIQAMKNFTHHSSISLHTTIALGVIALLFVIPWQPVQRQAAAIASTPATLPTAATVSKLVQAENLNFEQASSDGQSKYDFNSADYREDVGKGFSVADELLASAARDEISLATIAMIRANAGLLAQQHQQIKKLYALSDEKDVWKKRKELFLKYVTPVLDSPQEYLADRESANSFLKVAELCCTNLMFGYAENEAANAYANKAYSAIQSSQLDADHRKFLATMFKITMADLAYDSDQYDRGDELLGNVLTDLEVLMKQKKGRFRIEQQANLIFPAIASEIGIDKCRQIASELYDDLADDKGMTDYQRHTRRWALLAGESFAYMERSGGEPFKQWVAIVNKELQIELDKNLPFSQSALEASCRLRYQLIQLVIDTHPEQAVENYRKAFDTIRTDFKFANPINVHLVDMANVVITSLANRNDERSIEFWEELQQFLAESKDENGNPISVSQINKIYLGMAKLSCDKFLIRNSILEKPAPELIADAMIHRGQSVMSKNIWKDFDGKVILFDFWNVDCRPCIKGFPHLTELEKKYGEQGLVVIGVTEFKKLKWSEKLNAPEQHASATVEQELEALVKFAEKHNATHRLAIVSEARMEQLVEKFGVRGNPFAFLIDRKGVVRKSADATQIEAKGFEETIKKLLDEKYTN